MPFVISADCEALCTPHDEKRSESKFYSHHVPCSIGYKLVTDVPVLADEPYQSHTGADVVDWFMRQMLNLQGRSMDYLFDYQRLVMALNNKRKFARAFECYICHCPFNKDKVLDHDHLTENYGVQRTSFAISCCGRRTRCRSSSTTSGATIRT